MRNNCLYCKGKNIQKVMIRFSDGQEQRVILCKDCHKISYTNEENEK